MMMRGTLQWAVGLSFLICISLLNGADSQDNPCAYTLCIMDTTCISIPDEENCISPESCEMKARCIPTGAPNSYSPSGETCGEETCELGSVCRLVKKDCRRGRPCYPTLSCVRFPGMPTKDQNKDSYQYTTVGGTRPQMSCSNIKCKNGTVCAMEQDCTDVKYPSEETCPLLPVCKNSIKENHEVDSELADVQ
ncbi:unnamed protein product [Orchesella dallaii]|uniref:Uncharacterized protein n=1 Tax=Orchesella dallaii TaxID=48710 RepID=A0ABP1PW46_9HEXA